LPMSLGATDSPVRVAAQPSRRHVWPGGELTTAQIAKKKVEDKAQ
jgi:hypothetical protein